MLFGVLLTFTMRENVVATYNKYLEPPDLPVANRLLSLFPGSSFALVTRGVSQIAQDEPDPERALRDFNRAIELEPRSAIAYLSRSNDYLQLGLAAEALADAETIIELEPGHPAGHFQKAVAKLVGGDFSGFQADMATVAGLSVESPAWDALFVQCQGALFRGPAAERVAGQERVFPQPAAHGLRRP